MSKKWEEEAEYYEAHRDDPGMWGDPVEAPIVAPRNGLAISVTVRFSPDDAETIRQTAQRERKTYSEVVRAAVHRYTQSEVIQSTASAFRLSGLGSDAPLTRSDAELRSGEFSGRPVGSRTASSMTLAAD